MRHQPTDRRDLSGRSNRQATWSAVATVMIAGTSVALAQSATPAQPPVNTGLSSLPMLPPTPQAPKAQAPSQSQGQNQSQNRNVTPPVNAGGDQPMPLDDQAAAEPGSEPAPGDIKVDDNLIVDLHLNNEDLSKVLEMLSIQSQRNIVASGGISNAKVSANLYGVTFFEALDAILHPNGFGYIDRGNMIYVHTLEELKQIEQASRVRVSKIVTLSFLNAIDAAEFVKPLLSEGGSIKTPGKTKDFSIPGEAPTGADEYALDATLVIYDYDENVVEIEKLLKGLDTKPAQVLVEATIVQTALNENNAFGVDFSLIADMNFADFSGVGGPLKAVDSMINGKGGMLTGGSSIPLQVPADDEGRGLVSSPGNTSGPGTLKLGIVDKDVAVFVKMLDEVSDTTILSNPKILAVNRQPSRVLVGRKVGYLNTTSTDTTTTQSVEFLDTGTQLYFRPFVSLNDNMIRMELKPQVSEAVIRDATDVTGAAVTIPDEITNELVTNVMVKDGQTIVLGGLFRESTQSSRKQVPFLGDIPLIGNAFRGHEDEVQRSEIIFLITPSIVKDDLLAKHGKAAKDYVDHARTGAREGLLPWSREKMTGMKLIEAQKLAAAGDADKARWKLQQSLALNQNQPDAIGLLKELGGDVTTWSSRSVMEDIVNNEVKYELRTGKVEFDPDHWPTPENHDAHTNTGAHGAPHHTATPADSASVTFTPSSADASTSQPATEPAVDLAPTTPENFDSGSNTFTPATEPATEPVTEPVTDDSMTPTNSDSNFNTTPSDEAPTQPQYQPEYQPEFQPSTDPATEPAPTTTPEASEFAPPTPNDPTSPAETTPSTPENASTENSPSDTTSTAPDQTASTPSTTEPAVDTTASTNSSNTTEPTTPATTGESKSSDTAIAGTQAERQVTPTDPTPTDPASTNTAETSTNNPTPVNNDSTANQAQDTAASTTPASTDSTSATTTETNAASHNANTTNTTNTTDSAGSTATQTSSADTTSSGNVTPTTSTQTPTQITPADSSPTSTDSTANPANPTNDTSDTSAANPTNQASGTSESASTNSNSDSTTNNTNTTDAAAQPNSGFEASEATGNAGVVHGEKSNIELLTNAIQSQAGADQSTAAENAENSPESANSSSQNADNNSAAGSSSDAQSQTQSQTQPQAQSQSASGKSKSKSAKDASVKEVKPGKSAATSKTNAAATKTAKANTKDSKAAKAKAAQAAKKKKSSWGIFDFLRPESDDEKKESTVTKGQDDTGPPSDPN